MLSLFQVCLFSCNSFVPHVHAATMLLATAQTNTDTISQKHVIFGIISEWFSPEIIITRSWQCFDVRLRVHVWEYLYKCLYAIEMATLNALQIVLRTNLKWCVKESELAFYKICISLAFRCCCCSRSFFAPNIQLACIWKVKKKPSIQSTYWKDRVSNWASTKSRMEDCEDRGKERGGGYTRMKNPLNTTNMNNLMLHIKNVSLTDWLAVVSDTSCACLHCIPARKKSKMSMHHLHFGMIVHWKGDDDEIEREWTTEKLRDKCHSASVLFRFNETLIDF